jgi:LPPG:FO 2-phospho-L-lactate transferase
VTGKVVVLTGGVGGAKLVLGLTRVVAADQVTAIVNTGDDFWHLGLRIAPDIDTLLYTLAGKANAAQGWGRAGETWNFMEVLKSLGGPEWFLLGDGDLALHVVRTARLAGGEALSGITRDYVERWGVGVSVLPMSDDAVSTHLATDEGEMAFQKYFVARRCAPVVKAVRFDGALDARPGPGVLEAIASARAIFLAPSNPYLSIDPILAVPGIREALVASGAPVVAVSPIVGGQAVKGPTAKLMAELGVAVTPAAVAAHYGGILDAMLVDERDSPAGIGVRTALADTLMVTLEDRARVARAALALADACG